MLKSLYISSFVIIDQSRIHFFDQMNALTGETGAGKSIIVEAIGQLCGNRSSSNLVKKGATKAIIEGLFDIELNENFIKACEELHIDPDNEILISKEINENGRSTIKINYQVVSNAALKLLSPYLIDTHSQFETYKLFEEKNHIHLLDEYCGNEITIPLNHYQNLFNEYRQKKNNLKKAIDEDLSDEQLEYLQAQVEEIESVSYSDDEVEDMEKELKSMQNFEKTNQNMQRFQQLMSGNNGALSMFKEALSYLESSLDIDEFQGYFDSLYNEYYNISDVCDNVLDIFHDLSFDEYRYNELQDTIYKINRLKRKYGLTMERIHEEKQALQKQIEHILNREDYINQLKNEIDELNNQLLKVALVIHEIREKKAKIFEKEVQSELKSLYLENAQFNICFIPSDFNDFGNEKIQFMVSMNKGQDLSLLNESASGGEMSRLILAIKTIILKYSSTETIVFDEIDTGVSGKVASAIGDKMKNISQYKQVICITHLPQVASKAHNQFLIEKKSSLDDTVSSIHLLNEEEKINEIAKMLSGETITQEAISNAKKLLKV